MPTTIKKVTGTTNKLVVAFDSSPTVKDLLDVLKSIEVADRTARLKVCRNSTGALESPVRFTFVLEAEQEVDVPVV